MMMMVTINKYIASSYWTLLLDRSELRCFFDLGLVKGGFFADNLNCSSTTELGSPVK